MNEYILEMKNVFKRFPGVLALNDVNMQLKKGEILGICGENGAGKSTLMKVLSGSYVHGEYEGSIRIDGKEVDFRSVADAQAQGIEMVYQEMNMMLDATIAENLYVGNLPGKGSWVDYPKLYEKTRQALHTIKLDQLDVKTKARSLNSGQMQLLSLMRARVKNPRILVLDEPSTALTTSETDTLMEILQQCREDGISCIYISHKLEEVFRICDTILVMRDGKTIQSHPSNEVTEDQLIEEMVGRKIENLYPHVPHEIGDEILEVRDLSVPHPNLEGRKIVDNISFSVRRGEILGIGGLVGAGRSEALGGIFGQFDKGVTKKVYIEGKEVKIHSPLEAIELGIGFITEERKKNGIIPTMTIRENMSIASLAHLPKRFFIDRKAEQEAVQKQFDALAVKAPSLETKIIALSGGNQQKVILGKWLIKTPKILFVDEPTKGIDVGAKAAFYQILGELAQKGIAIVMISSDMPELIAMSDRCIVLSEGHITSELQKADINETNIMKAAIMRTA